MKRILFLAGIIGMTMNLTFAQQVRYKVKKDDPMDFKNFMLHLDPIMMDCYLTNITLGVAARADYMVNKVFDISGQIRKPYFDFNEVGLRDDAESTTSNGVYGKNGIKPMSFMEGTLQLHFLDKIKETNHRIVFFKSTSTSGNYQTVTTKFVDIPGHVRKIKSLRGGAIWMNTAVDFNGTFGTDNEYKFTNKSTDVDTFGLSGGTMMRSMIVYAGLSGQTIANFKVLTDKYGMKYVTPWNSFYADFMFAPVLNFADVISNKTNAEYNVENIQIKRTGWRVGYIIRNTKGTSWSMALNFGARPGIVGEKGITTSRAFFDMNLGISMPYNLSLKSKKKD
jgi:hypothetical protein